MRPAMEGFAPRSFTVPPGVTVAEIDLTNGKLANRFCPRTGREVFLTGTEPETCREHGGDRDRVGEWGHAFPRRLPGGSGSARWGAPRPPRGPGPPRPP